MKRRSGLGLLLHIRRTVLNKDSQWPSNEEKKEERLQNRGVMNREEGKVFVKRLKLTMFLIGVKNFGK